MVEANLKACLAKKEASGQAFNIAYGGRETLNDLYDKISELLNINKKPIYASERAGDIKHSNADISKAKLFLNYNPKYSMGEGLSLTIKWYKENL